MLIRRDDLRAAVPGWLVARAIVLTAAAAARFVLDRGFQPPMLVIRAHTGLMSWDADWYRRIATHGYGGLPHRALRFFPLHPLLGKVLSLPLAGHVDWALLVIANVFALVLGALVHRLVMVEKDDAELARRAAWLIALSPPAFVLVMGYSEPLALSLAVACFLSLRTERWWWAAAAGLLAALTRPVGVLLAIPALVEAGRGVVFARAAHTSRIRRPAAGELVGRAAAVLAPAAGAGLFLLYVWNRFGDAMLPIRMQGDPGLRGRSVFPIVTVMRAVRRTVTGDFGRQLHLPWVLVAVARVVVVATRWPSSYAWYAGATVALAVAAEHLGSLERYTYGAFPVVLGVAGLLRRRDVERAVFALSAAAMGAYAAAAFVGAYVP